MLRTVVANFAGRARRVSVGGREYLIAPLTLIVPGVLQGSKGALFYPEREVANSVNEWQDVPIVVRHPTRNGQNISVHDADVLNRSGIGVVRNPTMRNRRLVAEGWFDIDKTRRVDRRVHDALVKGQPIELSTGLYTDNVPAGNGANWRGREYTAVARNYKADHLAILPDEVGACSIKDGCGVLVPNSVGDYMNTNCNCDDDEPLPPSLDLDWEEVVNEQRAEDAGRRGNAPQGEYAQAWADASE